MPRQLILECVIDLPDHPLEQADAIVKVRDPLRAFMMEAEGLGGKTKLEIVETRAKLMGSGVKRGRKPKATLRVFEPQEPPSAA